MFFIIPFLFSSTKIPDEITVVKMYIEPCHKTKLLEEEHMLRKETVTMKVKELQELFTKLEPFENIEPYLCAILDINCDMRIEFLEKENTFLKKFEISKDNQPLIDSLNLMAFHILVKRGNNGCAKSLSLLFTYLCSTYNKYISGSRDDFIDYMKALNQYIPQRKGIKLKFKNLDNLIQHFTMQYGADCYTPPPPKSWWPSYLSNLFQLAPKNKYSILKQA